MYLNSKPIIENSYLNLIFILSIITSYYRLFAEIFTVNSDKIKNILFDTYNLKNNSIGKWTYETGLDCIKSDFIG